MAVSRLSKQSLQNAFPKGNTVWDGTTATSVFDSLGSATVTSATSTITFSSIPSTYSHLQIRGIARNTSATTQTTVLVRLNGDANPASYRPRHLMTADGSAVQAYADGSGSYTGLMIGTVFGGNNTANHFGPNILDFIDYTNTNKVTTAKGAGGTEVNGTTVSYVYVASGLWLNTAIVTSISLTNFDGANFAVNTTFSLYGVK